MPHPDKTDIIEVVRCSIIIPDHFVIHVFVIMEVPRVFGITHLQCQSAAVLSGVIRFVFPNDFGCSMGGSKLISQKRIDVEYIYGFVGWGGLSA